MDLRLMVHHLTKILKFLNCEGCKLVASADVSAKLHDGNQHQEAFLLDTHSWFLLYDPDMRQETRWRWRASLTSSQRSRSDLRENAAAESLCIVEIYLFYDDSSTRMKQACMICEKLLVICSTSTMYYLY